MAKLDAAARKAIPKNDFAVPSKAPGSGSYPIPDASHARNALARASGKPVQGQVDAAVHRKFPDIGKGRGSSERNSAGPKEDSADRKGDGMRPMSPGKSAGHHNGRGHMGGWADKMHPVGRS